MLHSHSNVTYDWVESIENIFVRNIRRGLRIRVLDGKYCRIGEVCIINGIQWQQYVTNIIYFFCREIIAYKLLFSAFYLSTIV